jgi:Arc/MetJ-type ribon-helix-helix transcriptional regulator
MKEKLSITIDKRLIEEIDNEIKSGRFRNKSHIIEFSISEFLKQCKGEIK